MFDFSDNQKNPLMFMMNMMNMENTEDEAESEETSLDPEPMQLMMQAMGMQLEMMQTMCTVQLQFMQGFAKMMGINNVLPDVFKSDADASSGQPGVFKLGNIEIPPWLLTKLMQMDMSPENLEKLQRVLDFVFEAMPQAKDE